MKLFKSKLLLAAMVFFCLNLFAQAPENWFHLSPTTDGVPGLATEQLYKRLPATGGDTVIVAIIDSGVDAEHEDLKDVMWVNKDEIPDNGIDDDNNGYIDDIHGWNFIGNSKGENIRYDNLEVTRLYVKYRDRFENVKPDDLKKKDRELYEEWLEMKETVENKRESLKENFELYASLMEVFEALEESLDEDSVTAEMLENLETSDPRLQSLANYAASFMKSQGSSFEEFGGQIQEGFDYFDSQYSYNYNPEFEPRELVGDNYADKTERYYGNNDVEGPDAFHGTHVAGIVAASRNNDIGMDGVAKNVLIMSVRTVPDGDERDKDVANAIRYAVDNGAKVINMSFGKGYSPYKEVVDDAVKYALKNDVLLVHAAGNAGQENSESNNFPNDRFEKKGLFGPRFAKNWIEVGALNYTMDENMVATFSNYSPEWVDVFAPGVQMYSTTPNDSYEMAQGTSMAAPAVAGVAALLRSYFPDLSVEQIKEIIVESAIDQDEIVVQPGTDEKVLFSSLSVSGGITNVVSAFELAIQTKGKNKKAKRYITELPAKEQDRP